MQKAIRRGQEEIALRAAATLLRDSPDRLWRRCGVTAFEDIGVADLEVVAEVAAALAGKTYRAQLGGQWQVASTIVTRMARATKCRAADDLLTAARVTQHSHPPVGSSGRCPRRNCSTSPLGPAPCPNAQSPSGMSSAPIRVPAKCASAAPNPSSLSTGCTDRAFRGHW
jgi:hypothetical protein